VWDEIQTSLPATVTVEYVAGGLAADSDLAMPLEQQQQIQGYWQKIQQTLGTEFNFDFWAENTPRRSTYLACRAVIAAKNQRCEAQMVDAIQRGYYLQALNPSDSDVLLRLAWSLYQQELGIDLDQFTNDLTSADTERELQRQIALAASLTDQGFPSLVLEIDGQRRLLSRDYQSAQTVLTEIATAMAAGKA
jgi:putative protein-disulfide isomerase